MFTLIIAIISIALIVATLAASSYFGGDTINDARAQTEAARLKIEEQQILASMDVFNADHRRWPIDVHELVATGYLISVPQGVKTQAASSSPQMLLELLPVAHAAEENFSGWSMPMAQQPIFWTAMKVEKPICQKYNMTSRGDNGILRKPFADLPAQCFGEEGSYQVLVRKSAAHVVGLGEAIPGAAVQAGGLPTADAGSSWWDTAPTGGVQAVVDPDKKPYAKLVLATSSISLGNVQVGKHATSSDVTVTNQGNAAASTVSLNANSGFSIVDSTCGTSLGIGGTCKFAISFSPTEARSYIGTVGVSSANGGALQAQATGTGVSADASLTGINFGNLPAKESRVGDVILRNTGIDTMQLGSPVVDGEGFAVLPGGTCGASLAAGEQCTLKVQLTGIGTAHHSGFLSILTEAGIKTANLAGQSQQVLISVSPATHTFAATEVGLSSDGPTHTIENTGNIAQSPLTIQAPGGFRVKTTTCLSSLPAGGKCAVSFQFSPLAIKGYADVATVSGTKGIDLIGQGVRQDATLSNVDLSQVPLNSSGTGTATLKNTGGVPLTLSAINLASVTGTGFSFYNTTCGASLAVGASCSIVVSYSATSVATNTGALSVTHGGGTLKSVLTGKGYYVGDAVQYTGPVFGGGGGPDIVAAAGTWGTSSSAFRFVNTTGAVLSNVKIVYGNASYFKTGTSNCGVTVGIGEVCTFYVQYYSTSKSAILYSTVQVQATGYQSNAYSIRGTSY